MNYDEMPAGRAMDAELALLFGYTFVTFPEGHCPYTEHWRDPEDKLIGFRPPPFSEDIAHAWKVAERMQAQGFGTRAFEPDDGTYLTRFTRKDLVGELGAHGIQVKDGKGDGAQNA